MLICAIAAQCQQNARYEIFKTIGSISNASTGVIVKKGDAMRLTDKLKIDKDSKAGILDRQQNRIYYSPKEGTHSVAAIIRDAKRKADNVIATVNSEALKQTKQAGKRPTVMGVSYRGGEEEGDNRMQAICNAIFDICSAEPDSLLSLQIIDDDGAFHFSLSNETDSLIYVNVVSIRPETLPQLCLSVGMSENQPYISIAPKSQIELPDFVFSDEDTADYYMFATSEPIDSQALSLMLNRGTRFAEVEKADIIVSPKITKSNE